MEKLLLCFAPSFLSPKKLFAKIKRKSILKKNKTKKTLFQQLDTTPLKQMRRNGVIKSIIIVKKRVILLETALNLQKN